MLDVLASRDRTSRDLTNKLERVENEVLGPFGLRGLVPAFPCGGAAFFPSFDFPFVNCRRAAIPQGKKTAPPKWESGSATGESGDRFPHSKLAASPRFKT